MSKPRQRTAQGLLQRLLDEPQLVTVIQGLDAPALMRLIRHVGLEDAGEIISLATTEQLERVFDEDLWRSREPGQPERFDAERFSRWLEVMLEMGESRAAQLLAEMDEDFVTLALSRQLLVFDLDALVQQRLRANGGPEDDLIEKALDGSLCFELDQYLLISTGRDSWDAVLAVLTSLDSEHHDALVRILDRCRHFSAEYIEDNGGLYDVLTAAEQLQSDVAGDREDRREREGFVPPQAAASFLALAREAGVGDDAITRAHFWGLSQASATSPSEMPGEAAPPPASETPALLAILQQAQVLAPSERTMLLDAPPGQRRDETSRVRAGVAALRDRDPALLSQRLGELGYLSNALLAGCHFRARAFRPSEAMQAALAACDLGLEELAKRGASTARPDSLLSDHTLVYAFGVGWSVLHREVAMRAARTLRRTLAEGRLSPRAGAAARDTQSLAALASILDESLRSEKPWLARERLRALHSVLDAPTLGVLLDLMDECPTFDGAFLSSRAVVSAAGAWLRRHLGAADGPL